MIRRYLMVRDVNSRLIRRWRSTRALKFPPHCLVFLAAKYRWLRALDSLLLIIDAWKNSAVKFNEKSVEFVETYL